MLIGVSAYEYPDFPPVRAAREHGVPRIFSANELVGAADIRYVAAELRRDPEFEFYCLADSVAGVRLLAGRLAALGPDGPGRPVNVLVEGGMTGARCGVRDVATAVELALTADWTGHHRALLCAADIAGTRPSLDLAARIAPSVPVTDPARYRADPGRALVDCSVAAAVLGWRPRYRWAGRGRPGTAAR